MTTDVEVIGPVPETESPIDAVLRAAGLPPDENREKEKSDVPGSAPVLSAEDSGEALLLMVDAITVAVCRAYAVKLKIQWTDESHKAVMLSRAEKLSLKPFASAASKYLYKLLLYADAIAAGVFGIVYWSILTDKFDYLKNKAPHIKESKRGKKRGRPRKEDAASVSEQVA